MGKLEVYYDNELIKSKEIVSNTDAKSKFYEKIFKFYKFFCMGLNNEKFITFEGIDASEKSTQIKIIYKILKKNKKVS